jgi:tetratricopeptide (TPR) repeat protein
LHAVRAQLADLGLDWDLTGCPAPDVADAQRPPIEIAVRRASLTARDQENPAFADAKLRKQVDDLTRALAAEPRKAQLYYARAWYYHRLGERDSELSDLQKAVELNPEHYSACNNLAWLYVKGPERLRAPEKALPLAQRAVRLKPDVRQLHNNLGVAYYRLGQCDAAISAFERAADVNNGEATAFELFFLAMSYERLGDKSRARDMFEQAIIWIEEHAPGLPPQLREDLKRHQAEAESVLSRSHSEGGDQ